MTEAQGLAAFERAYARAVGKKRLIVEAFRAVLSGDTLVPRRGCTRKTKTVGLDDEVMTKEPGRILCANVDDRLMLTGASIDQIAIVRIKWVRVEGWTTTYFVEHGVGGVNDGEVWAMRIGRGR